MTEETQIEPVIAGENVPAWREVFLYFLMLGFINIGGPVARITMMFKAIVRIPSIGITAIAFVSIAVFKVDVASLPLAQ